MIEPTELQETTLSQLVENLFFAMTFNSDISLKDKESLLPYIYRAQLQPLTQPK